MYSVLLPHTLPKSCTQQHTLRLATLRLGCVHVSDDYYLLFLGCLMLLTKRERQTGRKRGAPRQDQRETTQTPGCQPTTLAPGQRPRVVIVGGPSPPWPLTQQEVDDCAKRQNTRGMLITWAPQLSCVYTYADTTCPCMIQLDASLAHTFRPPVPRPRFLCLCNA
jgi:hypothetical protein